MNIFEMLKIIFFMVNMIFHSNHFISANQSITHLFAFLVFFGWGSFRAIKTPQKKKGQIECLFDSLAVFLIIVNRLIKYKKT